MSAEPFILYVPEVAMEKIFSFLNYDEIARNRIVCKKFNEIGGRILSRGFIQLEKLHNALYKRIRSSLPRRESERKVHPLSRHCDILQAVETRISMLNMTYMKYIEYKLICFIPGKVLDEMLRVLRMIEKSVTSASPSTMHILQELRDLSSMAMEHFDENILPRVREEKEKYDEQKHASFLEGSSGFNKKSRPIYVQQISFNEDLQQIKRDYNHQRYYNTFVNRSTQRIIQTLKDQGAFIKVQTVQLREQKRKIYEQNTKIKQQENQIIEIKKHLQEWENKYQDWMVELVRIREDCLAGKANQLPSVQLPASAHSTSPSLSTAGRCQTPKLLKLKFNDSPLPFKIPTTKLRFMEDSQRKRKSNLLPDIPVKLPRKGTASRSSTDDHEKSAINAAESRKSDLSSLIDNLIKVPLTLGRKRKISY